MNKASDRSAGISPPAPGAPDETARRAAALEALSKGRAAQRTGVTFWEQHGGRIVLAGAVLLALLLVALTVGKFMRVSITETGRSEEALRRGLR